MIASAAVCRLKLKTSCRHTSKSLTITPREAKTCFVCFVFELGVLHFLWDFRFRISLFFGCHLLNWSELQSSSSPSQIKGSLLRNPSQTVSKLSLSTKRLTEVNVEETVDHISVTAKLMLTVKAYKHVILGVLIEK